MRALLRVLIIFVALILAIAVLREPLLRAAGNALVESDSPKKADLAVVLAGDGWGNRVRMGGQMVRDGYVPVALVSGPPGAYGFHECDLAIPFAVREGFPESYFKHEESEVTSTAEEAAYFKAHIAEAHSILLITSNYHTRRAAKLFRQAMPGVEVTVIASRDHDFDPTNWWQNRQARKVFLYEWMKTVATVFGL